MTTRLPSTLSWLTPVRFSLLLLLTALGLTFALYLPTLFYWWTADDYNYMIPKPPQQVASFYTLQRFRVFYRPLVWHWFVIDYQLWGWWNPLPARLQNVLLKLVAVALLWQFLRQLPVVSFLKAGGMNVVAGLAALFFAVMPDHPGAVTWVNARFDVVVTTLFIASLVFFTAYLKRPRWWVYALAALCIPVGIMCKENAMTIPAMLLLADLLFFPQPQLQERRWGAWLLAKLRLHTIFILLGGGYLLLRLVYLWLKLAPFSYTGKVDSIQNTFDNLAGYLAMMCGWQSIAGLQGAGANLFILGFFALALPLCWYGGRLAWFGLLWLLITLVPVMNIFIIESATRYVYLPSVGLAILLAAVLGRLLLGRSLVPSAAGSGERSLPLRTALAGVLTLLLVGWGAWGTVQLNEEHRLAGAAGRRMIDTLRASHPTLTPGTRFFFTGLPYDYKRVLVYGSGTYWAVRMAYGNDATVLVYPYELGRDKFNADIRQPAPTPSYYLRWEGGIDGSLKEYSVLDEYLATLPP